MQCHTGPGRAQRCRARAEPSVRPRDSNPGVCHCRSIPCHAPPKPHQAVPGCAAPRRTQPRVSAEGSNLGACQPLPIPCHALPCPTHPFRGERCRADLALRAAPGLEPGRMPSPPRSLTSHALPSASPRSRSTPCSAMPCCAERERRGLEPPGYAIRSPSLPLLAPPRIAVPLPRRAEPFRAWAFGTRTRMCATRPPFPCHAVPFPAHPRLAMPCHASPCSGLFRRTAEPRR